MAVVITTTGISLWNNVVRSRGVTQPSEIQLQQFLRQDPEGASAETNSLLKFLEKGDELVLLHTEDENAKLSASVLGNYFSDKGYDVRLVPLNLRGKREDLETRILRNFVDVLIGEIERAQRHG
ncbi:MAG: hypothetical protein NZL98_07060, partial [Anaerolineales bacterium]|nr:hypothetical protein [Anaerolineales bacterium]